MTDETGSVAESEASVHRSATSTPSPYRCRFNQYTRREAWEQRMKKTPPKADAVFLQPRLASPSDEEKQSSATTNTSISTVVPTDEIDGPPDCERRLPQHIETQYYRIAYRGVVALVSKPDSRSARTGVYVSYGEIIASHHVLDVEELESVVSYSSPVPVQRAQELCSPDSPPRSVMSSHAGSVSSLDTMRTASSTGATKIESAVIRSRHPVGKKAVRVDQVLTGGYAIDASEIALETQLATPKRSNVLPMICSSPLPLPESSPGGNDLNFQELGFIMSAKNNVMLIEKIEKPPLIQAGKFMYQIVSSAPIQMFTGPCLDAPRNKAVLLPGTIHEVCLRLQSDEDIFYLRLSHRRGWITDRKVTVINGAFKIGLALAVKEYAAADDIVSMASSATPSSVMRRRHRPPRRKQDIYKGRGLDSDPFPASQRQNTNDSFASNAREMALTTSSNFSVLSDISSFIASPDRSIEKSRVLGKSIEPKLSYFLVRVNAPRGLKMLDALQFQVSNLIHGSHAKATAQGREGNPSSIFATMAGPHTLKSTGKVGNPAIFDSAKRQRILPKGAVFEASRRMEISTSFNEGVGLIKLSDNSGWAIVPTQDDLDLQYLHYHGGITTIKEGESTRAFEEIGNAMIYTDDASDCIWVRVVGRQGVTVECPPPFSPPPVDGTISPTHSAGGSSSGAGASNFGMLTSHDSDVASSVGSAFLDAMFRPQKKIDVNADHQGGKSVHPFFATEQSSIYNHITLACGTYLEINKWDELEGQNVLPGTTTDYVRLRGGRGWVPRSICGKPAIERIAQPETRVGSFWFRVLTPRGIKVRRGPSRKAASIKTEDNVYFRFECGEFLRACEVVTFFPDDSSPESFAKLYRNRHVQLYNPLSEVRSLQSLTTPSEWVQVLAEDFMYVEELTCEPRMQRNRGGWRYNVVRESGVNVRKGPSFAAETVGMKLLPGESVLITERVTPPGERINWLRLKDGIGWVHDIGKNDEIVMIAHSLRERAGGGLTRATTSVPGRNEMEEKAYHKIVARLFPGTDEEEKEVNSL